MTTQIAILNKNGLVLAADSAVTFSPTYSNRQTYNTVNKLFELGEGHSVAIMIFSSVFLNSVPWETVIAIYCKGLAGKKPFASLEDYGKHFIEFLREHNKKFVPLAQQEKELQRACVAKLRELDDLLSAKWENTMEKTMSEKEFANFSLSEFSDVQFAVPSWSDEKHFAEMFAFVKRQTDILAGNYKFAKFVESNPLYNFVFGRLISADPFSYTGIVFGGIGEDDMFSSLYSFNSYGYYLGRLRVGEIDSGKKITHDGSALIVPFAQTDMIDSFLYGIHDVHLHLIQNSKHKISQEAIAELENNFQKYNESIVSGVYHLSLGQLADVARDLLRLSILRKQVLPGDDSVGGPIDVAVISKSDGFKWIDKKSYFRRGLLGRFFSFFALKK